MASVNKVILIGRLGRDPELRKTTGGTNVASFSMATSEKFKNKSGEMQEKTEWHNIILWSKLAELAGKYLRKGREVYIEGKLQTSSWEDKNGGGKKYKTEVVATSMQFLGGKSDSQGSGSPAQASSGDYNPKAPFGEDEDLPF